MPSRTISSGHASAAEFHINRPGQAILAWITVRDEGGADLWASAAQPGRGFGTPTPLGFGDHIFASGIDDDGNGLIVTRGYSGELYSIAYEPAG